MDLDAPPASEVEDAADLATRTAREQMVYYQRIFAATCVRSGATAAAKAALLEEAVTKRAWASTSPPPTLCTHTP